MKKKKHASSQPGDRTGGRGRTTGLVEMTIEEAKRQLASGEAYYREVSEDEIDFSDIPELTDEELKRFKPADLYGIPPRPRGRPPLGKEPRKLISIKLDPALIERLKRRAKKEKMGYQSLIHRILEQNVPG